MESFPNIAAMLGAMRPTVPVYCIHPRTYQSAAREFVEKFPGRVLYAVKANNDPMIVSLLRKYGIRNFDCASLDEITLIKRVCPDAKCYFMNPVRIRGAARAAQREHGVRHFMIDDQAGLQPLVDEINAAHAVIFVRMAVSHHSAAENLSVKFGARPEDVPGMLAAVAETGAEAALAFNVGSGVRSPDAYRHAINVTAGVLDRSAVPIRLLDIGGGFPRSYPGYEVPPLSEFFATIRDARKTLALAEGGEIMAEPGRALSAPGLSAVAQVLLRKDDRIYINDGMYGALWELRCNGQNRYAVNTFRGTKSLDGDHRPFRVFGPTCDASDCLPEALELPADIAIGDYIEFESVGAYSLSGRTDFNGFGGHAIVRIDP